jgi:hypothetical protein
MQDIRDHDTTVLARIDPLLYEATHTVVDPVSGKRHRTLRFRSGRDTCIRDS